MIKTRTVVQVRTHAQKYFAKQKKRQQMDGPGNSNSIMSITTISSNDNHLMSFSFNSTNTLSSSSATGHYDVPRRLKKATSKPKLLVRSGSMDSTTTSELSLTPRMRKRTATHQSDFFYEDVSDDADTITTSESTPKRRNSPRAGGGGDANHGMGVALFDPRLHSHAAAAGQLTVDLAFDADFRADIIASELAIDGMGGLDKLGFIAPGQSSMGSESAGHRVSDDETSVEAYSPMSHTETNSTHEDELFLCANEAMCSSSSYPYPSHDGEKGDAMFSDLDTFIIADVGL